MKTNNNPALILLRFLIALACLFVIANAVFGMEIINSHPVFYSESFSKVINLPVMAQIEFTIPKTNGVPDVSTSPLPSSTSEFWTYAIAVIVPLIVGGMKKAIPVIPKWVLPVSTPFVGLALGAALKAIGAANMSWVDMAQAGALAVMIRESWSQLVTVPLKGEQGAKTKDQWDVAKEKRNL